MDDCAPRSLTNRAIAFDAMLADIASLRPVLVEQRLRAEEAGRVAAEISARLVSAGAYRVCQPARFGGLELGPSAMFRLGVEIGQGCGSTAWCTTVSIVNSWMVGYWPLAAQETIWARDPRDVVIGVFAASGKAERVAGGYQVAGRWTYASNCDNAQWIAVGARLPDDHPEKTGVGWFMIPAAEFEIDHASWRTIGMQGTGSKTVTLDRPVFVADHMMIQLSDILARTTPGRLVPDNPMAGFSFTTFGSAGLVAPIVGMARAALDWFTDTMRTKPATSLMPGAGGTAGQNVHNQIRIGTASAALDAAEAMLLGSLRAAEAKIFAGEELTVAERLRVRRDVVFAARQASDAVNLLFEGAGAAAARSDSAIQLLWRNVNAAARHVTLEPTTVFALYGQERLGMQPVGQF